MFLKFLIPQTLVSLYVDGLDTVIAVMVHKVNNRSQRNVIRLYKFINENNKFVLKSELAAFSLPDAKSATSFAGNLLHMSIEELFISLEGKGGKMAEMAPHMLPEVSGK